MSTAHRFGRAVKGLIFLAAVMAPQLAYPKAPTPAPPLPAPRGAVMNVSNEAELQEAVKNLHSNETIVLAPGIYRLTSTLWINRTLQEVAIRGGSDSRDDVVLVGPGMAHANSGLTPYGIWTGGGVQGITIANLTIRDVYYDAILFDSGTDRPRVYNVHFIDAGDRFIRSNAGARGHGVNDGLVEYSVFEFTTTTRDPDTAAIDVHGGAGWKIRDNLFHNIVASSRQLAGPAIAMSGYAMNTLTERNMFLNCSRGIEYGLKDVDGFDHAGGMIRNNIFYRASDQPGDAAIVVNDSPNTQVLNNTVFVSGTYGTPIEYRFPDTHDVVVANNLVDGAIWARDGATGIETNNLPGATANMFVDVAAADLHLSASATAAIDRGYEIAWVTDDWDGEARPSGFGYDIGADERGGISMAPTSAPGAGSKRPSVGVQVTDGPGVGGEIRIAATSDTVFIGGRVTDSSGVGVAGVTVGLSGAHSLTVTTDVSGIYLFSGMVVGADYTVTPSRSDTSFAPDSYSFVPLAATVTTAGFAVTSPNNSQLPSAIPDDPIPGAVFDPNPPSDPDPDPPSDRPPLPPGSPTPASPSVALTAPLGGSTYTAPATLTIRADASTGTGSVMRVDFYVGSTLLGADTTAPYSLGWTNVGVGTYWLTAKATNSAGLTATSTSVSITVNPVPAPPSGTPPTVSLTAPVNGSTYTAPATITLSANANTSGDSITKVDFYAGATLVGTDTSAPFSRSWTNVAAGSYALTAIARDSAGLTTQSTPVSVTVNPAAPPSATPPSVSLTAPAGGSTFTAPATITVSANASTTNGSITQVDFYAGSTLIGTDTSAPFSRSWTNVSAGTYALTAKATNSAGLTTTSAPTNVTVNAASTPPSATPPTVSMTAPTSGTTFTAPATITVSANAGTSSGSITQVDFYTGSTLIGTDTSAPFSRSWTDVAAGTYALTAKATNSAGLTTTSAPVSVTVNAAPPPPSTPPIASLTAPASGSTFTALAAITVSANASTSGGSITKVDFYAGSTLIATDTTAPFSITWSSVPAGSYSLTAKATNSAGVTTTSTAASVTVNAPSAPPAPPALPTTSTATFRPSTDDATNVTSYKLDIFTVGANPATAAPMRSQNLGKPPIVSGNMSVDISSLRASLPAGSYFATVTAIGPGGNATSAPSNTFTR